MEYTLADFRSELAELAVKSDPLCLYLRAGKDDSSVKDWSLEYVCPWGKGTVVNTPSGYLTVGWI